MEKLLAVLLVVMTVFCSGCEMTPAGKIDWEGTAEDLELVSKIIVPHLDEDDREVWSEAVASLSDRISSYDGTDPGLKAAVLLLLEAKPGIMTALEGSLDPDEAQSVWAAFELVVRRIARRID